MIQIALYGKGGIGKSTIAANISAALSHNGSRVLQVGCDPKRDSTRLLLEGSAAPSVLDYIRNTQDNERHLEDIMIVGNAGVACVEAGGPEPGIGCAGRGILSTFELLETLGIRTVPFEVIIYDVLGDVVCGGFAVPLRKGYADAVLLVTSGEYMSIYAANNILRGVANSSDGKPRVAGIIHNGRGLPEERERVTSFANAVGLPVVVSVPRDSRFADAEKAGCTILETSPGSELAGQFTRLATHIHGIGSGKVPLFPARALSDAELEKQVLGRSVSGPVITTHRTRIKTIPCPAVDCIDSCQPCHPGPEPPAMRPVLRGCAFAGAVRTLVQIDGARVVAHAPRSCSHIVSHFLTASIIRKETDRNDQITGLLANPSFRSTDMDEESAVFGGRERLENTLMAAARQGHNTIFVVTSCTPGIIGDDTDTVADTTARQFAGLKVICLPADGNISGDFSSGIRQAYRSATCLIDHNVRPEQGWVNIIGEISILANCERTFFSIEKILNRLGLRVNCRFLGRTTLEKIRSFNRAGLCLPFTRDAATLQLQDDLSRLTGTAFFELPFPVGFHETVHWTETLGAKCGTNAEAARLIEDERSIHEREVAPARKYLRGRRVILVTDRERIGWVLDIIHDTGMEIDTLCLLDPIDAIDGPTDKTGNYQVKLHCSVKSVLEEIESGLPDLVLSTVRLRDTAGARIDILPRNPDAGFRTSAAMVRRWGHIIRLPAVEGWRQEKRGCMK